MNAPEHLHIERPAIDGAQYLPINLCEAVSFNPRKRFDPAKLDDLAASIEKFGVMQPVLARPKADAKRGGALYEIVAGERRLRACKLVASKRGEGDIAVIPAIVRELTDFEARELATTENLQRDDLHPLEEAEGYEGLLLKPVTGGEFSPKRLQGYTVDELAARLGKSRGYVFGRLKLLALVPEARTAFYDGKLQASVALMVARMPAKVQEKALPQLLQGWAGEPYSHRQASEFLHKNYMLALKGAVFNIADADLVAKAGSCHACPKRTGAAPDLFDDVKSADTCTDPACFEGKAKAHGEQLLELAREKGLQVVTGPAAKKLLPYGSDYLPSNAEHVNLDKPAEDLTGSRKNLRTLLGDDFKGGMLVKPEDGDQPITLATKVDVKAALKAKGLLQPSKKSSAGSSSKPRTADDIRKQRDNRIGDMLEERLPRAFCKHLADDGAYGLPDESLAWMRALAKRLLECSELDCGELGTLITGTHQPSMSTDWIKEASIEHVAQAILADLLSDHVSSERFGHRKTDSQVSDELAKEVGYDLAALRKEVAHEIDSAIRDEIESLKQAAPEAKPTAKPAKAPAAAYRNPETGDTWSGKGLQPAWLKAALAKGYRITDFDVKLQAAGTASTPPISAAAQGAKPGQQTPVQALAEAVAKEATPAPAAKKKASQKDNTAKLSASKATPSKPTAKAKGAEVKDKAAAPPAQPPAAQLSSVAAWPFPKGQAA